MDAGGALQERLRAREEAQARQLEAKAAAEATAKRARVEKARQDVEEYLQGWREEKQRRRGSAEAAATAAEGGRFDTPAQSWAFIAANIPQKESDYPGTKSLARMKATILSHAKHLEGLGSAR